MSNSAASEVIDQVNGIREKIKDSRSSFRDQSFLDELARSIADNPQLGRQPVAQALVRDLRG